MLKAVSRRCPLVLVADGLARVQRARFTASLLHRYVTMIVISEEAGVSKPDPRIFESALATLRLTAREVLLVGDSISGDMAAAAGARMDFCWFNPSGEATPARYSPRWIIRELSELPPLLESEGN